MVQAVSLQGRDRHDDGMDIVAGTQVGNFFQCAAHRDTVDGLAQLVGVIIHGYDDMAVAGVGLADIDGPRTSSPAPTIMTGRLGSLLALPRSRSPSGWFRKSRQARRSRR